MKIVGHILGYPRIGSHRELKKALESYWSTNIQKQELLKIGYMLRTRHWQQQKESGLDLISVGDFSWYDHVLTTSLMLNNIPARYQSNQEHINLDTLFKISRGCSINNNLIAPSEMKKWFNTNYHYIVPEFVKNQKFQLNWMQLFSEIDEALSLNYQIKPILLGPISYLWLGKIKGDSFDKLSLLPSLISTYQEILSILSKKNIDWIQIDEPVLVLELPKEWLQAYVDVYKKFHTTIKILLTTYFDHICHQLNVIKTLPIHGLHVDLISNPNNLEVIHKTIPKDWILSVGVINGKNIWKTNLYYWFKKLSPLVKERTLWVGSSCSLLHSPIDINLEFTLNENQKKWFAFAIQKCTEIKMLCTALQEKNQPDATSFYTSILKKYNIDHHSQSNSNYIHNKKVQENIADIDHIPTSRNTPYTIRHQLQNKKYNLPLYPTTTIGSFPQTKEIRNIRLNFKNRKINEQDYQSNIKKYIKKIIKEQEKLDLDILVHGEPERNDMVEYFGENLEGFIFTQNGWVQSYGSRCVKPPIIFGDINRPHAISIKWINYAQSLTKKPIKGILTGPITMMFWSFIREDIQKEIIALQLALAIREEIMDLEKSGTGIIQIDEPALREGLPLKSSEQKKYLRWATNCFKITVSSVKKETQIHTHMCYSELNDIIYSIAELDVDVISIEASRSEINVFQSIKEIIYNNLNSIGPGIYDIHSPNIPTINNFIYKINQLLQYIPKERLWINPDCGLKTRSWSEIKQALHYMVTAAKILRYQNNINKKNIFIK